MLPLVNLQAASQGNVEAARHVYAQLAAKLDSMDAEERELLRAALVRLSEGVEAHQAFAAGEPKHGPKVADGWHRDYALWLEFDELANAEIAAGRKVVKARIYRQIAARHVRNYNNEPRPLSIDTVTDAIKRVERAMVEHDTITKRDSVFAEQAKEAQEAGFLEWWQSVGALAWWKGLTAEEQRSFVARWEAATE